MALLFAAYFVTAEAGSFLHSALTAPALIWPPAGIALAGLILCGPRLWPAIFLASVLQLYLGHSSFALILVVATANTAQALVGAYFLRSFKFNPRMERIYDVFVLGIVGLFATMIVPSLGTLIQVASGTLTFPHLPAVWGPWWTGEMLSIFVITPLVLRWIPKPRSWWKQEELSEAVLIFAFLAAIDLFLFWTPYTSIAQVSLTYVMLVPLFWIGLRMGVRTTTLALFLNAVLVLIGTAFGYASILSTVGVGTRLLQIEIFLIIISMIFMILSSIAEERKNATDALREHVLRLEKAIERISFEDDAKSQFIATLAHELRNPLAPLVSSLEIMSLVELPEIERAELITSMTNSIGTMRHLLDDLLDISRISRRKLTLDKERLSISEVVKQSISMIESFIRERGHTLEVTLPEEPVYIEADRVRLEQILVNLLNNAAKYTDVGGTISLTVEPRPGTLTVCIKDSGIGIAPELLEDIFNPFMQIERGERKVGGLGIGLSLTKSLVDLHGGTIEAKSAGNGSGSEFIVRLPYIEPTGEMSSIIDGKSSFFPTFMRPAMKILVVDDNQTAANALQKLLTLRGYDVETAYSGLEAIEKVPSVEPRVIMLDIGLPDLDGYEVARRLRDTLLFQGTLIALTGYGQETDKQFAEGAGFDHHLTKPAGLAEIEEILSKVF